MKRLIIPIMLVIISSSCTQEENIRPEWPFQFVVVNDGNKELTTINLNSSIYYPLEDSTNFLGTIKSVYKHDHDENKLKEFDSLKLSPLKKVYHGCVTTVMIRVNFLLEGNEVSFFFSKVDTIRTYKDSSFEVVWPRDSILFTTK
jgi:hypothetical protein